LRLLPQPEPIAVALAEVPDGPPPGMVWRRINYRFVRVSGPERIGVEWWALEKPLVTAGGPEEPADAAINDGIGLTRDYYVAEDEGGRRFWLFREGLYGRGGQNWYLHGFFA
jgi:protein ImuB